MADFVLYADTACDLSTDLLKSWNVRYFELTYMFTDDGAVHTSSAMPVKEFYDNMRSGRVAKTSAVNIELLREGFEKVMQEGKDLLYLAFDSALSTTYSSSVMVADEVMQKYPGRKIIVVDSLCASAGYGLLVSLAKDKRDEGAGIDELAKYLEETRHSIVHWFTVDDLVYLKRGGRVSAVTAIIGSVLSIKPVLHVDEEGRLIKVSQVRGRKSSVQALAQHMAETWKGGRIYISHGDCMEDVETLKHDIRQKCGAEAELITDIGPVIGAHSGPGTLALFFVGSRR